MKIVHKHRRPSVGDYRSPIASALLSPASLVYRVGSSTLKKIKQRTRCPEEVGAFVVSVGNIEAGGGGKTPLCIYLLENLFRDGYRPAYVSRGFKSGSEKMEAVTVLLPEDLEIGASPNAGLRLLRRDADQLHQAVGDEGAMVASRVPQVPLFFSRDKAAAVQSAVSLFKSTHIIMDDAFQSWGVHRDLDIVLLDSVKPFGNGRLLPAGTLREGIDALCRADFVGFNDIEDSVHLARLKESVKKAAPHLIPTFGIQRKYHFLSPFGETVEIKKPPVASLSSIARPESFDRSLERHGFDVRLSIRFPDHFGYGPGDADDIRLLVRECGANSLITTEKDWVKLKELDPGVGTVFIARMEIDIIGENFLDKIKKPQVSSAASL